MLGVDQLSRWPSGPPRRQRQQPPRARRPRSRPDPTRHQDQCRARTATRRESAGSTHAGAPRGARLSSGTGGGAEHRQPRAVATSTSGVALTLPNRSASKPSLSCRHATRDHPILPPATKTPAQPVLLLQRVHANNRLRGTPIQCAPPYQSSRMPPAKRPTTQCQCIASA
jgi:hypothetical protein